MNKNKIIKGIQNYIKKEFKGESTGHDWWHIFRVWKMAKEIAKKESGDLFIIELGALLHDIADWKFHDDVKAGSKKTRQLLNRFKVDEATIKHVCDIVDNVSFKGAGVKNKIKTLEGKIVQDSDRLDVIGAMGIARTFAYGGSIKREIYNPSIKPKLHKSFEEYKKNQSSSINHFYEKILLLKDRLNTKTAKKIAIQRHKFLENYLKQFFKEWEIKI
ncbi:MAG: uncharacterized protein CEN87_729 [Parcubacteria group bacterium Licking1014_1]|nr:MAG: uncharacterized protein CEN87_729 [Parcubacteria group bacterium Licking1014_1]